MFIRQDATGLANNANICHSSNMIDANRANLGYNFFHHLIYDNNSFQSVNEDNLCSLIHFFLREAAQNGRPVQFFSG